MKLLRAVPETRSAAAARADVVSGSESEYSRALQGTPQWAESESESDGDEDVNERVRGGSARAPSRHGRAGAPPPVETAAAVVDWHMQLRKYNNPESRWLYRPDLKRTRLEEEARWSRVSTPEYPQFT